MARSEYKVTKELINMDWKSQVPTMNVRTELEFGKKIEDIVLTKMEYKHDLLLIIMDIVVIVFRITISFTLIGAIIMIIKLNRKCEKMETLLGRQGVTLNKT
jgi:hypothetical protein